MVQNYYINEENNETIFRITIYYLIVFNIKYIFFYFLSFPIKMFSCYFYNELKEHILRVKHVLLNSILIVFMLFNFI